MNPLTLGWIDYSSDHRDKVLAVLHALSSEGAVDELGIGQIRDGFSDILFPGTSTIQTRAKYFFIVPYLLMELEKEKYESPNELVNALWENELELIDTLNQDNADGVIGARSGKTLKRKPSAIYWSGLRTFGIFKRTLSLQDYAKAIYSLQKNRKLAQQLGNDSEEGSSFNDINGEYISSFWRCIPPEKGWKENINISLTKDEASFLKERIVKSDKSGNSLLAHLLENYGSEDVEKVSEFRAIGDTFLLPDDIAVDFSRAKKFNEFISGANIRYNMILSQGKNEVANEYWQKWINSQFVQNEFESFQPLEIVNYLKVKNPRLRIFLSQWQKAVLSGDEANINQLIVKREVELKTKDRAKLNNTKMYSYKEEDWIGARDLQYRFLDAKVILNDIFSGLEVPNVTTS